MLFNSPSDFVILGLQEFVPKNMKSIFFESNTEHVNRWHSIIAKNLLRCYPKDKYIKAAMSSMADLCLFVYGKEERIRLVGSVRTEKVKMGFQGVGEDKGAVIVR